MYPNQNPQSNPTPPPSDEWFTQSAIDTPPPKYPKRKLIIVAAAVALLMSGTLALVFALRGPATPPVCFAQSNYTDLLAVIKIANDDEDLEINDVKAQQLLYTHSLYFIENTATIDADASPTTNDFIKALGDYSKTKQQLAPIVIRITAHYTSSSDVSLLLERLARARSVLINTGFDSSYIVTDPPTLVGVDADTDFDEEDIVTLSIAPSDRCAAEE